jgi:uncharacterized membrane protein YjjP (DUF1212 family)
MKTKKINKATVNTFKNTDAGKDLHKVSSVKELAKELNKDKKCIF